MNLLRRQALLLTLLLAAMLLRGLLPVGTMLGEAPGEAGFRVVLCTPQGAVFQAADTDTMPAQGGMDCPYGFALSMGAMPAAPALVLPTPQADALLSAVQSTHQIHVARSAHPARGPPSLV